MLIYRLKASFAICLSICLSPVLLSTTSAQEKDSVSIRTASVKPATSDEDLFGSPQLLMVGKSPLNTAARQMYPSPAMFDVDNDGQLELVVGDIFGSLNVYENINKNKQGDPVWSKHKALESLDGKPIKVSNW